MKPIFQILAAFFVLTSCNPNRLALLYDAPGENSVSHMRRSI